LVGGHDTTSTTLCWGFKFLSDYQLVQAKFRSELYKNFSLAVEHKRSPTFEEITASNFPYLDAIIEEVVRTALTAPATGRIALQDTTILGYHIPKGTDVFIMANGPGFFSEGFPIDEKLRHESAKSEKVRHVNTWSDDRQEFKPERWFVKDEFGNEKFDAQAGPHLAFGGGPRGCYGRKLAYLEMRVMLVMIIWNFELKKCPKELSSYADRDTLTRKPNQFYLNLQRVNP
jgi:cytochrome P450